MMENDRQKPVTGYPAAQSSYPSQSGYPSGMVAYPYPAPPPAPNYYQPYPPPPPPPYDRIRFNFLRRIIIVVISIFLIIGAISFIFWLVLRPRAPVIRLDSVSTYPFNISSTHLTATFNFSFTLLNPNKKMGVYYDEIVVSVGYKYFLKASSEAPLYQKKGESTLFRSLIVASSENVEEYTAKKLSADRATGTVDFNVRVQGWIRYKSGIWRSRSHLMRAFCDDVKIGFSNSTGVGTLLGSSRNCEVYLNILQVDD